MGFNKFLFSLCIIAVIFGTHVSQARKNGHHSQRHRHRHRSHHHSHQNPTDQHKKVQLQVPIPDLPHQDLTDERNKVPTQLPTFSNLHQDFLDEHNRARAEVGVGPLKWNDTLATYAQDYANKKIETCEMVHSKGPYGECLAKGSIDMTGAEATKLWVSEKPNYDYSSNTCLKEQCGHYTQVVWKSSTNLGCAKAQCKNGWVFVICNYYPPGNYIGEKPY